MNDSKFRPGTIVRDNRGMVGKVVGVAESIELNGDTVERVTVDFWGEEERRPESWLTPLDPDSPEALLLDRPEELASWADEVPLKLVALALSVNGGVGKVAAIREKLDGLVIATNEWNSWWKRVQPKLKRSMDSFKSGKTGKDTQYTLLSDIEDVPSGITETKASVKATGRNKKAANKGVWAGWLASGNTEEPVPGASGYPGKAAFDAVSDLPASDTRKALTKVLHWADKSLSDDVPDKADSKAVTAWRNLTASAALRWREHAKQPGINDNLSAPTGKLLHRMAGVTGYDKAPDDVRRLVKDLTLDDFEVDEDSTPNNIGVNLLDYLTPAEKSQLIGELLVKFRDARACHTAAMAELRNIHSNALESEIQSHQDTLREIQAEYDTELKKRDDELKSVRREQERLQELVDTYEALMASGREESRLEIRQGMLLAVGDALQRAFLQGENAEERLENVITTLPNALREGEAETLGTVGATVKYDPRLHHSPDAIPSGAKVRLAAPGVIVGERVILKASVSNETEVC